MNKFNGVCILRGGTWYYSNAVHFRAHFRNWIYPDSWGHLLGFRCVSPESSPIVQRFVRIK